ncbi:MAG: DnaB-like helicase N-terminal domain-containing protein [Pirellulales bacterium]
MLGSMMLLPDVIDDVAGPASDDFYDDAHRRLFTHMLTMHDAGQKIDPVLLANRLHTAGDYEEWWAGRRS